MAFSGKAYFVTGESRDDIDLASKLESLLLLVQRLLLVSERAISRKLLKRPTELQRSDEKLSSW